MSQNDSEPKNENADDLTTDAPATESGPEEETATGEGVENAGEASADADVETAEATATAAPSKAKPAAMTPGERLAAQKAAKAAKKIAARGREAELVEQKAIDAAEGTTRAARSWVESHVKQLAIAAAAVVVLVASVGGVRWFLSRDDAKAGALLWKATEAAQAEIRTAEASEAAAEDESLTFPTAEARDREAIARYGRVISTYPKTAAALYAHLGRAATLLGDEKPAEARAEYERVAGAETDQTILTAQALEGIGVTYVEERDFAKAKHQFDELRTLDHERYRDLADFHLARVLHAQGQDEPAKQKLRTLLEHLGEENAQRLPYVQQQAELLLQQLDPSTARRSSTGSGPGGINLNDLPPEILEQLLRQSMQGGGQ